MWRFKTSGLRDPSKSLDRIWKEEKRIVKKRSCVKRTRERVREEKGRNLDLGIGCGNMKRRVAIVESGLVEERGVGL